MRRREFVTRTCAAMAALTPGSRGFRVRGRAAPWLLVPMDDGQADHLKAYGLAFRLLERGGKAEWFLNYRGGAFLLPADGATSRDAALAGITTEPLDDGRLVELRGEISNGNMDAVPLEKAPKVAVYAPPNAAPWDDAVTMALNYAGIGFEKIWDSDVVGDGLRRLRLAPSPPRGLHRAVLQVLSQLRRRALAGGDGGAEPERWRARSASHRCRPRSMRSRPRSASTSSEVASCSRCAPRPRPSISRSRPTGVDIAASYADGTPMDSNATAAMRWDRAARLPGRPPGAESDDAGLLRHRRAPGQLPGPAPAAGVLHAVQLQREDRSGGDDAGPESPAGDPRFLRADHELHPAPAQAERHGAGRGDRAHRG